MLESPLNVPYTQHGLRPGCNWNYRHHHQLMWLLFAMDAQDGSFKDEFGYDVNPQEFMMESTRVLVLDIRHEFPQVIKAVEHNISPLLRMEDRPLTDICREYQYRADGIIEDYLHRSVDNAYVQKIIDKNVADDSSILVSRLDLLGGRLDSAVLAPKPKKKDGND